MRNILLAIAAITASAALVAQDKMPGGEVVLTDVQLLTEPQGVDFGPYLKEMAPALGVDSPQSILCVYSHRFVVKVAISRNGSLVKVITASQSGSRNLDSAALGVLAGANHRFPPFPDGFEGDRITLQFTLGAR